MAHEGSPQSRALAESLPSLSQDRAGITTAGINCLGKKDIIIQMQISSSLFFLDIPIPACVSN